ncbi:hypothetical protein K8S17_03415, partial [bacterium]|nr:hypothetical protein [bacterium]
MNPRSDSSKAFRLARDKGYRRRVLTAFLLSAVVHIIAIRVFAPLGDRIPLVRHIGYYGPTNVLPEISVIREVGSREREVQFARGEGGRSVFRVVPIVISDWLVPEGESEMSEAGEQSDDVAEDG